MIPPTTRPAPLTTSDPAPDPFIRETAARIMAAIIHHHGFAAYNADDYADQAVRGAMALDTLIRERKL